jgi:ABC-2 type transport system ATP-binding protein
MSVLEVTNLTKSFSVKKSFFAEEIRYIAVNNISFSVKKGEILGFLGHNGAGKTTTIQMLLGTLIPDAGLIQYFGLDFNTNFLGVLKKIGYASGYDKMHARLTVYENLDIVGRIYGMSDEARIEKIKILLDSFGMLSIYDKQMGGLSAGQTTCVLLVKAFMADPDLVFLDEPTASLDPETAYKVRQFILKKNKENNTSILITSHNMEEVSQLCDRVIILNKGIIVANNTPEFLAQSMSKVRIHLSFAIDFDEHQLVVILDRMKLQYAIEKNTVVVNVEEEEIASFLIALAQASIMYLNISIEKPTLEDYFLSFLNDKKGE